MKFLKKAVSALLAGITAVTMLFAGSVTASAASSDVYVDGGYDAEGQYTIRVGGYGVREFMDYTDSSSESVVHAVILSFDDMSIFTMVECVSQGGDNVAYMGYPLVNFGSGFNYDKNVASLCYIGSFENAGGEGILIVFPKGSKAIDRLASAKKVALAGGIYQYENDSIKEEVLSFPTKTVTPNFKGLEKTSTSDKTDKTDSTKKEPATTGKRPKTAKTGTPMPEYTVEGYYTSKNEYQIVLGGIPKEEYEYLKACDTYFNKKGRICFRASSLEEWKFWFSANISSNSSYCFLSFDNSVDGSVDGEVSLEKIGDSYTCTCTFPLNSAAKKAIEKRIKKTNTDKMRVDAYYSVKSGTSSSYDFYNYYNGKNSGITKSVKYDFTNEIKGKSASSTEVSLKKTTLTAKRSGEKITFSWDKVNGAEKYQIYYREKGESKYKKLANVSGSKTSYSTSKLDKSKTYQFIIRSYATSDGKKVYSKYSKAVTVK